MIEGFDDVWTRLTPPARLQILPVLSGEPAAPDTPSHSSNSHTDFREGPYEAGGRMAGMMAGETWITAGGVEAPPTLPWSLVIRARNS
jgi:hypothetical protein